MAKTILLIFSIFLINQLSFAQEKVIRPWPRVIAWSNGVDLTIDNYDTQDYSCSGPIYIRYDGGASDVEFYSGIVRARSSERRYYYSRRSDQRVQSAYESIFCYPR